MNTTRTRVLYMTFFVALVLMIVALETAPGHLGVPESASGSYHVSKPAPIRESSETLFPAEAASQPRSFMRETSYQDESWRVSKTLAYGQTLAGLLSEAGLKGQEAFNAVDSLSRILDMRRIRSGQKVVVLFNSTGQVREIRVPVRYDYSAVAGRSPTGWQAREELIDVYPVPTVVRARVDSSLYQAAGDAGIPLSVMMQAIELFSFEVDFQRDIHPGDGIVLLYEHLRNAEGEFLAAGELLYAKLITRSMSSEAWRYERLDGEVDYYQSGGESVRKALLKTPLDGGRISSRFGLRRHPILGYTALHRGTDFAVPTGTPVKASGDGTVVIAGWHNQYGWRVKLRHANYYDTMYAHFSRIAPGIVPGLRVKQGTVVGYVGSTGMSTGPHCHYEVHYYGSPIDPAGLKFPPGHTLEDTDVRLFALECNALRAEFDLE